MLVPSDVEERIMGAESPVSESVKLLGEVLSTILEQTVGSGVPLGINVESLSIFREEIDAAHTLFQKLQALLLNHRGSPWAVKWYLVHEIKLPRPDRTQSTSPPTGQDLVITKSNESENVAEKRTDGLALERSIMMATSMLSIATSALMLAKMFSDSRK
jgi:hypothetical protein